MTSSTPSPRTIHPFLSHVALAALVTAALGGCTSTTTQNQDDPFKDPRVLMATGYRNLGMGRIDLAISNLGKAHLMAPEDTEIMQWLAAAYLQGGQPDPAIAVLTKAIEETQGQEPEFLNMRGTAYVESGQYLEATDDFEAALVPGLFYTTPWIAWGNLGEANRRLGRIEASITAYRKATEYQPGNPMYRLAVCRALEESRRLDEALRECGELTNLVPTFAEGWYQLGVVLLAQGQNSQAQVAFERSLTLDPAHPQSEKAQSYLELLRKSR